MCLCIRCSSDQLLTVLPLCVFVYVRYEDFFTSNKKHDQNKKPKANKEVEDIDMEDEEENEDSDIGDEESDDMEAEDKVVSRCS